MQGKKLYVGNFSYSVSKEDLETLFSTYGEVTEVNVIEGRGFGFVEMSEPADAEKAKEALNGSDYKGRTLRVDEARPPRDRRPGGRGGFKKDFRRY
jgi:RNA recognition motif-containing protein